MVAPLALHLSDEAATDALGARLARALTPGLSIHLVGDLGAGKTALVRACLRALGHTGKVKSPTYTLVEPYAVSKLPLYHFDFYRLREPTEWLDAGFRDYFNADSVCLVEWPEKAAELPPPDLRISLRHAPSGRDATLTAYSPQGERLLQSISSAAG
ncbi:MAG TPA: tRNA (adenosine(37)-N6)-threonylcarbamoyltransferase complex ATPase subunit type 1 TsaE [Burkholderiales bacterium]|nr:tRNA (adenosine(37)-N6)-threonylcarbamoyltransferase complex ATPase subunit type 1 TsaE [Burkholderiales bacterium]